MLYTPSVLTTPRTLKEELTQAITRTNRAPWSSESPEPCPPQNIRRTPPFCGQSPTVALRQHDSRHIELRCGDDLDNGSVGTQEITLGHLNRPGGT